MPKADKPDAVDPLVEFRLPVEVTEPGRSYRGKPMSWRQNLRAGGFSDFRTRELLWTDEPLVVARMKPVQPAISPQ